MDRPRAPLLETPAAPKPPAGEAVFVAAADGVRLRAALFTPAGPSRGSVILSPGRGEFIEKYFEVIGELTARGMTVLVHDWRGQGLSDRIARAPLKGHARGWRPFIADYDLLLRAFGDRLPRPWIGLGHSMGGGLQALALAEGEGRLDAAVFSAPLLGLKLGTRPKAAVEALSALMGFVGRSQAYVVAAADPLEEPFGPMSLTHDEDRWSRIRGQILAHPELRLGAITWGWLAMALTLCARVAASRRIEALRIPVLVVLAGQERLLVNAAAMAFAHRIPGARLVVINGARHELLMETDALRSKFWTAFDEMAETVAPKVRPA